MVNFKRSLSVVGLGLMFSVGGAQATIATSVHNLGVTGPHGTAIAGAGGTERICVFCHTPHGSDTAAPVPLWNKTLPAVGTFPNTYDTLGTATLDGQVDLSMGGISLACLSCHDGSTALDMVLNAPTTIGGQYEYTPGGAPLGSNVTMSGSPVPMLGKDLRNDHPVGVQYAGGGILWEAITATNDVASSANDKAFNDPTWGGGGRLWVDVPAGVNNEVLPLYGNASTANGTFGPTVECASCHNPHKTVNGSFLRMSNSGSALCLACHIK